MRRVKLCQSAKQPFWIHAGILLFFYSSNGLAKTHPPIVAGHHFSVMWTSPLEICKSRFNISFDLSPFSLVSSTERNATNQSISLIYSDQFGIYPYVQVETQKVFSKGLPQLVDLDAHEKLAQSNIGRYIISNHKGLAVLDFEDWRPLWSRNWGNKSVYRKLSVIDILNKNPSLTKNEAIKEAKEVFEQAAKAYFVRSIRLGTKMRPNKLWGYYAHPNCHNSYYKKEIKKFTGKCPKMEEKMNDDLVWLWSESTALFPSISLDTVLKESKQGRLYVRHLIREALRVSRLPNKSYSIPVYAYMTPVYRDNISEFMSELDLVNTIGEAAALGAAGVILRGEINISSTADKCRATQTYLKEVMNRYILNVTTAMELCSQVLCLSIGRCFRKNWNSDVFLHLDPHHFKIHPDQNGGLLTVSGQISQKDKKYFEENFDCMCYNTDKCRLVKINTKVELTVHSCCPDPMRYLLLLFVIFMSILACVYF